MRHSKGKWVVWPVIAAAFGYALAVMEYIGLILLVLAALLGAVYSFIIKISANRLVLYASLNLVSIGLGAVAIWFVPPPDSAAWPYLVGAGLTYTVMVFWMIESFEKNDLSQLSPLISGVRIAFLAALTLALTSESAGWVQGVSIAVLCTAFLVQIHPEQIIRKADRAGILLCVVAGLFSGLQYFLDFQGVKLSGNPLSFIVWSCFYGIPVTCYGFWRYRRDIVTLIRKEKMQILTASFLDVVGYALILYVVFGLDVLYVLPASNLSIVFATMIGLYVLKERYPARRLIAAALVFVSVVLMQL